MDRRRNCGMRRCTRQRCAGAPDLISRLIILRYRRRPVGSILPWPVSARGLLLSAIFELDRIADDLLVTACVRTAFISGGQAQRAAKAQGNRSAFRHVMQKR